MREELVLVKYFMSRLQRDFKLLMNKTLNLIQGFIEWYNSMGYNYFGV